MKRIKTLCLILLIIFFGSLYQGAVLPFVEGVKYGFAVAKYEGDNKKSTDEFLLMDVVAKDASYMETNELNIKTGEQALLRLNNVSVLVHSLPEKPVWWEVLQVIYGVLILVSLVLGIWIPFLVVKILRSLQHSEVFDRINLKRINRIGIFLLIMAILGTLIQLINVVSARYMVDLTHYTFSFAKVIDFDALIMAIVILIMNEVLRIAIEIKEEQDLTI